MLKVNECTLYSGGHVGAEVFFGECAERWGVREVTYSYDGHLIKREKNVVMLNENDLRRGDVSMEIVSMHMNRKYAQSESIRRVLQSIFHIVNSSAQVFTIGVIQDDNTVKGGTGWGVELGKFFNRIVFVFDKERKKWYRWSQGLWVEDIPCITEKTFCGTGSRELTNESKVAIEELYARSFG